MENKILDLVIKYEQSITRANHSLMNIRDQETRDIISAERSQMQEFVRELNDLIK